MRCRYLALQCAYDPAGDFLPRLLGVEVSPRIPVRQCCHLSPIRRNFCSPWWRSHGRSAG